MHDVLCSLWEGDHAVAHRDPERGCFGISAGSRRSRLGSEGGHRADPGRRRPELVPPGLWMGVVKAKVAFKAPSTRPGAERVRRGDPGRWWGEVNLGRTSEVRPIWGRARPRLSHIRPTFRRTRPNLGRFRQKNRAALDQHVARLDPHCADSRQNWAEVEHPRIDFCG